MELPEAAGQAVGIDYAQVAAKTAISVEVPTSLKNFQTKIHSIQSKSLLASWVPLQVSMPDSSLENRNLSLTASALKPQGSLKASPELLLGDRLFQNRYMTEVREANGVSATNDKGDALRHQRAGDMTGYFDIETHIERRAVDFFAAINDY
jgi:hypothetical protein